MNVQAELMRRATRPFFDLAGLIVSMADHASPIVTLGHKMIRRVLAVLVGDGARRLRVRVGVHSGCVMAGLVGVDRLTFGTSIAQLSRDAFDQEPAHPVHAWFRAAGADIWSTDMLLAAELERTATPSRVHISEATKKLLNPSHFRIDPADPVLDETNGRLVARY